MITLEDRQKALEHKLATATEQPVLIHPNMGKVYRAQVEHLATALNGDGSRAESADILRGLIDRIVVTDDLVTGTPKISLEASVAGIPSLSQTAKTPLRFLRTTFSKLSWSREDETRIGTGGIAAFGLLSDAELDVCEMLLRGVPTVEIAEQRSTTLETTRSQIKSSRMKLSCPSRLDLLRLAIATSAPLRE